MSGPYYLQTFAAEANAAAEAALLDATSSTSLTIPAVGDSVGPIDIGTGKECPPDSTWKFSYTGDASKNFNILVTAYNSGDVYGICTVSNGEGSGPYDSWAAMHISSVDKLMSFYAIEGLGLSIDPADRENVIIQPGRIVDSTGTREIHLRSVLTKQLNAAFAAGDNAGANVLVSLSGTINTSSTAVTGTGTNLLVDFGNGDCVVNDWEARATDPSYPSADAQKAIITHSDSSNFGLISAAASATAATSDRSLNATDATIQRGGNETTTTAGWKVLCLGVKDSDGDVDAWTSSPTPSGEPDKPSGYTAYAVLALVKYRGVIQRIVPLIRPAGVGRFDFPIPAAAWTPRTSGGATLTRYGEFPALSFSGTSINRVRHLWQPPEAWDPGAGLTFTIYGVVDTGGSSGHVAVFKAAGDHIQPGSAAWDSVDFSTTYSAYIAETTLPWTANDSTIKSAESGNLDVLLGAEPSTTDGYYPGQVPIELWRDPTDTDDNSSAAFLVTEVVLHYYTKASTDE